MSPLGLETLFTTGSETKIESNHYPESDDPITGDPDLPPESVRVPIRDELLYITLNKVLDRGFSTIGNANPKSCRSSSKPKSNLLRPNHGGSAKPPNGPILGLPNSAFHGNGSRPIPTPSPRFFPTNFSVEKKPAVLDPGSPKVSCFGNVLSDGERKIGSRGSVVGGEAEGVNGSGCWPCFAAVFGFPAVYPAVSGDLEEDFSGSSGFSSEEERKAVPELQGMKRFASRRREDGVDGTIDGHVVSLEPLDRECSLQRT